MGNKGYESYKTSGSGAAVLLDEKRSDVKSYIVFGPQGCGKTQSLEKIKRYFNGFVVIDDWQAGDAIAINTVYLTNLDFAGLVEALKDWPHPLGLLPFSTLESLF